LDFGLLQKLRNLAKLQLNAIAREKRPTLGYERTTSQLDAHHQRQARGGFKFVGKMFSSVIYSIVINLCFLDTGFGH